MTETTTKEVFLQGKARGEIEVIAGIHHLRTPEGLFMIYDYTPKSGLVPIPVVKLADGQFYQVEVPSSRAANTSDPRFYHDDLKRRNDELDALAHQLGIRDASLKEQERRVELVRKQMELDLREAKLKVEEATARANHIELLLAKYERALPAGLQQLIDAPESINAIASLVCAHSSGQLYSVLSLGKTSSAFLWNDESNPTPPGSINPSTLSSSIISSATQSPGESRPHVSNDPFSSWSTSITVGNSLGTRAFKSGLLAGITTEAAPNMIRKQHSTRPSTALLPIIPSHLDSNILPTMDSATPNKDLPYLVSVGVASETQVEQFLMQFSLSSLAQKTAEGYSALHLAAFHGNLPVLEYLLNKRGFSVSDKTLNEQTLLIRAAKNGKVDAVKYLIAKGSEVNAKDAYGESAITLASAIGASDVVEVLYKAGASISDKTFAGHSPILKAAMNGRLQTLQYLKSFGADIRNCDRDGYTPLLCASLYGYFDMVKWLIEFGGSQLWEKSKNGHTAILCAARDGHLDIIQYLYDNGAVLLDRDKNGVTVMIRAAMNGQLNVVQWVAKKLPKSVEDQDADGDTPLMCAAMNGHLAVIDFLLSNGASVKERNKSQYTPLIRAAMNGKQQAVERLLAAGSQLSEVDKDGYNALMCAALHGHLPTLEWMVNYRLYHSQCGVLDVQNRPVDRTNNGRNLLMCASRNDHRNVMTYLLEDFPDYPVNDKDANGDSAAICAAMNGHLEALRWLVEEKKVNILQRNNEDHTVLIRAAMNGRISVVQWLLSNVSNLSLEDVDLYGYTAFLCAALHGHVDMLNLLAKVGIVNVQGELEKSDTTAKTIHGQTALLSAARNGKLNAVKWLLHEGFARDDEKDFNGNDLLWCAQRSGRIEVLNYVRSRERYCTEEILIEAKSSLCTEDSADTQ